MKRCIICLIFLTLIFLIFDITSFEINTTYFENISFDNSSEVNITILNITILNLTITEALNDTLINFSNVSNTHEVNNTNTSYIENNNITYSELLNLTTNYTIHNESIINTSNDTLIYITHDTFLSSDNSSVCYFNSNFEEYPILVNNSWINRTISLSVSLCYNDTTLYCVSDLPIYLYIINTSNISCGSKGCKGNNLQSINNTYNILGLNDSLLFACWSIKRQDYYTLWVYQTLFWSQEESNTIIFDFSNTTFLVNEYEFTNISIFNNTNYSIILINNITQNISYHYNISLYDQNLSVNVSNIEARLFSLEKWRITVTKFLDYLTRIIRFDWMQRYH